MTGTKDELDWSHVAPEYKWMARDEDGEAFLFHTEPFIEAGTEFWNAMTYTADATAFASYKRGSCDWRDSLVRRPE